MVRTGIEPSQHGNAGGGKRKRAVDFSGRAGTIYYEAAACPRVTPLWPAENQAFVEHGVTDHGPLIRCVNDMNLAVGGLNRGWIGK